MNHRESKITSLLVVASSLFLSASDIARANDQQSTPINLDQMSNRSLVGMNLEGKRLTGSVCYHTRFYDSNLSNVRWHFTTVTRFCNFHDSIADGAYFGGWFYNQRFINTSLVGATFDLREGSTLIFENCDLRGVEFLGDTSGVQVIDTIEDSPES